MAKTNEGHSTPIKDLSYDKNHESKTELANWLELKPQLVSTEKSFRGYNQGWEDSNERSNYSTSGK